MAPEYPELSAYLDNELSPPERRRVKERLEREEAYARELRALERTRTMILSAVEQPAFHASLMHRIQAEQIGNERRKWKWGVAAGLVTASMLVLVMPWWQRSPEPSNKAALPAVVATDRAEEAPAAPEQFAAVQEPEQPAQASTQADAVPVVNNIRVVGTVTGDAPQALLQLPERSRAALFEIGDEVRPGVTVKAIAQAEVTLEVGGIEVVITSHSSAPPDPGSVLDGTWRIADARYVNDDSVALVKITHEGSSFTANMEGEPPLTGEFHLMGANLSLSVPEASPFYPGFSGTVVDDGQRIVLVKMLTPEDAALGLEPDQYVLTRVSEEEVEQVQSAAEARAAVEAELGALYRILLPIARENEGRFPANLSGLTPPAGLPHLFKNSSEHRLWYMGGLTLPESMLLPGPGELSTREAGGTLAQQGGLGTVASQNSIQEPSPEPMETYPDRLMAHEQALERSGYGKLLWPELLAELSIGEVQGELYINGRVMIDSTATGLAAAANVAQLRATDQNHLKQLGLVIKMYENEHRGYSPPGWLSVYPEYLTDVTVLTSPRDEPRTLSYEYLLPATHLEDYAMQFVEDPENPAAMAKAMSEVPVLLNKTDWPDGARNVLFADGHVEYIKDWRERLDILR